MVFNANFSSISAILWHYFPIGIIYQILIYWHYINNMVSKMLSYGSLKLYNLESRVIRHIFKRNVLSIIQAKFYSNWPNDFIGNDLWKVYRQGRTLNNNNSSRDPLHCFLTKCQNMVIKFKFFLCKLVNNTIYIHAFLSYL